MNEKGERIRWENNYTFTEGKDQGDEKKRKKREEVKHELMYFMYQLIYGPLSTK